MWIEFGGDILNAEHITHFGLNECGDSVVRFSSGVSLTRPGGALVADLTATLPIYQRAIPARRVLPPEVQAKVAERIAQRQELEAEGVPF